jgi:hypothetical protein
MVAYRLYFNHRWSTCGQSSLRGNETPEDGEIVLQNVSSDEPLQPRAPAGVSEGQGISRSISRMEMPGVKRAGAYTIQGGFEGIRKKIFSEFGRSRPPPQMGRRRPGGGALGKN